MIGVIDTAVFVPGVGLYAFADDLVWRFGGGRLTPDPGFPKAITAEFPGAFARRIDAAFVHPDAKLSLFRGDRHVRYDLTARRPEIGYPRAYAADWPGIFPRRIDAALSWSPDIVYVFAGDQYTSYSHGSGARPGFPKPIAGNWPGLARGPVRAALTLPGDRRVLITADRAHVFDRDGNPHTSELELPMLPGVASETSGISGSAPPLRSRRFLESPARADLQAVADGRLRLGRRGDPQHPAPIRSEGPVVREVQAALIELGCRLPHGADGLYGNEMYQTVLAYKRKHNIRTDSGFLDGIVGPNTIRHIDASLASPKPRPTRQPQDPKFTIVGQPMVKVEPDGHEKSQSTASVLFANGTFSIDAVVRAEAASSSDFDDWEVGIVQTVFDPVFHACYGPDPQTQQVLVTTLDTQGRRALPDRDQPNDRFMNRFPQKKDEPLSGVDLKSIHQGNLGVTRQLRAVDHVHTNARSNIPPRTGQGHNLFLFETFRSGRMITAVIARQISSGRTIPLHTVEWRIESRVRYRAPGTGIPLEVDGQPGNVFVKVIDRPFAAGDPLPLTDGKTANELQRALVSSSRPACPTPPPPEDPVLRWKRLLGTECREGNDVVELVDGAETFRAMHAAIGTAVNRDHYIYLLGWWLDINEPLDVPAKGPLDLPGGVRDCPSPRRAGGSTIAALMTAASAKGVQIRVMLWDQTGAKNTTEKDFVNSLPTGAAILDNHQFGRVLPFDPKANVGSQHQKVLLVKGAQGLVAFCGGVDINCDRICRQGACSKVSGGDPVVASSGSSGSNAGQPLHDVHCRIAGPAARDLLRVFVKRWFSNTSQAGLDKAKGPLRGLSELSEPVPAPAGRAVVRIGETYNADAKLPGGITLSPPSGKRTFRDRTVQEILLTVIGEARRYLYIEEQYLINLCAAEAIRRALPRLDHVTILIPPSEITDMPQRWALRKRFLDHICTSPLCFKVRVFTRAPTFAADGKPTFGQHTYVHAKMLIADDEVAVIGSANMNRRGWEHDAEVVAAVIGPGRDGVPLARKLRMRLWAEHLGVPESAVRDPIASKGLWSTSPARVSLYNPVGGIDPAPDFLIPGGEAVIDPGFTLASAPCCRIHGPSCPGGKIPSGVASEVGSDGEFLLLDTGATAGLSEESFELLEATEAASVAESSESAGLAAKSVFAAQSPVFATEASKGPASAGSSGGPPIAARILWPALGFPAVIAPRSSPAADATGRGVQHSASVLLLSDRATLTAADAARHLRIVPWSERTKRHIPDGQPGSFAATDLHVRTDGAATPLSRPHKDERGDAVCFGGDRYENSIVVSLARSVRKFYERQGVRYLHEIRIAESACARLADGQYHLFWNGGPAADGSQSDEMKLLIDKFAIPTRRALALPDAPRGWLRNNIRSLVNEYQYDYGTCHPPYQAMDTVRRLTEVLHPLFVQRAPAGRPTKALALAHITDTHINVRDDVYEENLKRAGAPISWDGQQLRYKGAPLRYNNWNRSFERIYADAKHEADVILMTGDLIDYGRGHIGLVEDGKYRHDLGADWAYHPDRNWFLYYYLLASGSNYTKPVYTILGNHDWRLNPYPPFAPGAPDPSALVHNYLDFEGQPGEPLKDILRLAHGPGHDTSYAYSKLGAERLARGIGAYFSGDFDFGGSPLETRNESVFWYLLLINPFLDYSFPLPSGQQVLMLDWGEDEEIYNFESAKDWKEYSQRARNCLSALQEWHVTEFAQSPGKTKVVGIHAPPLGPADAWTDSELYQGKKVFKRGEDSRMRKPDGTIVRVEHHSLCAVAPKGSPVGVAAIFGSIVHRRDWFVRKVGESASGIRMVLSGHIHREGLLVAYPPADDRDARLLRSVTYAEVRDGGRGVPPGYAAVRRDGAQGRAFQAPLYANTTSAGPRGNRYDPTRNQGGKAHANVAPGWALLELSSDGTIKAISSRWLAEPASTPHTGTQPATREAELVRT